MIALALLLAAVPDAAGCAAARARPGTSALMVAQACLAMLPERVIEGVWLDDFEGQVFYEGARTLADVRHPATAWIETDFSPAVRDRWHLAGPLCGHAYRVRFVGSFAVRQPTGPMLLGGYGHMGAFENLVVVDRLLVVTDLGDRQAIAPYCVAKRPSPSPH